MDKKYTTIEVRGGFHKVGARRFRIPECVITTIINEIGYSDELLKGINELAYSELYMSDGWCEKNRDAIDKAKKIDNRLNSYCCGMSDCACGSYMRRTVAFEIV